MARPLWKMHRNTNYMLRFKEGHDILQWSDLNPLIEDGKRAPSWPNREAAEACKREFEQWYHRRGLTPPEIDVILVNFEEE
jgi:hypothetical protein